MTQAPLQLPQHDPARRAGWQRLCRTTALVAAVFNAVVLGMMIAVYVRDQMGNPLVAADLRTTPANSTAHLDPLVIRAQQLQAQLAQSPDDDTIKKEYRQVDLSLRQKFFAIRARLTRGAWLLIGGLAVMLLSLKASWQFAPALPGAMTAFPPRRDVWRALPVVNAGILVASGALVAILAVFAVAPSSPFAPPETPSSPQGPEIPITAEQWKNNWPSFRGPGGCGIAGDIAPTEWDAPGKQNIIWKSPVPLPGHNSPIVWDGKVFLSGATDQLQEVYCFDAGTGALLWRKRVSGPIAGSSIKVSNETGYAAGTMATDGHRVFATFPTGDLAAFDFAGRQLWSKSFGALQNMYGPAASLALWQDRLIVQVDQGDDGDAGLSALYALDARTGKQIWRKTRPVPNSWASPIVIQLPAGPQIITNGKPWVIAYNPADGAELWKASVLDGDVAASPAFAAGIVYVANDQAQLAAIDPTGHGDVTNTHVKWTAQDGLPDIPSPLATDDLVLLLRSGGTATCYDAHSGNKLWSNDFEAHFDASPLLVGKTIYLIDSQGLTHRLAAAATFNELGTAELGEPVHASPALVGGRLFIRSERNLFCIGNQ